MFLFNRPLSQRAVFIVTLGGLTAAAASAGTLHRLTVSQTNDAGSLGSTAFLNTNSAGGAVQAQVGPSTLTSLSYPFGLFGLYNSSQVGFGVVGLSTTSYGIAGQSTSGYPSIYGLAGGDGAAIEGDTPSNSTAAGVFGNARGGGNGVEAFSNTGNALFAESTLQAGGVAYLGIPTGEGVQAFGYAAASGHPALTATARINGGDLFATYNNNGVNGATSNLLTMLVTGKTFNRSKDALTGGSDEELSGDLYVYGKIYQNCGSFPVTTSTYCYDVSTSSTATTNIAQPTSHGDVTMFATRQTLPSVEDLGTAHMSGGHAIVRIDPAFASTMDPTSRYMVFITPGGASRGSLYVTNRTQAGFEVAENGGGRSTLDFDYRIVARPIGDRSQRLVAVAKHEKIGALPQAMRPMDRFSLKHAAPANLINPFAHVRPSAPARP